MNGPARSHSDNGVCPLITMWLEFRVDCTSYLLVRCSTGILLWRRCGSYCGPQSQSTTSVYEISPEYVEVAMARLIRELES